MLRDVMHAMAYLCSRIRNVLRTQSLIDRLPRHTAVISAKCTRGGDGDKDPFAVCRIENDRVEAHAARTGLPLRSRTMTAETRQLIPRLTAVSRAKQSGVFNARENRVWIVK